MRGLRACTPLVKRVSMGLLKTIVTLLSVFTFSLCSVAEKATAPNPVSEVNPFIGTTNGGNVFPGAAMPFGMVQFSPEASPFHEKSLIAAPGGYEYRARKIRGFSLTNVEGWGCAGGSGDIPMMPIAEEVHASPSMDFRHTYVAGFNHDKEHAHPGYYHMDLDNGIGADFTASLRTGSALFHFPQGSPATVLIRTSDSEAGSTDAHTHVDVDHGTVSGSVTSGNFCGYIDKIDRRSYYTLYFVAEFDQKIQKAGTWQNDQLTPDSLQSSGGTGFGEHGFPEKGTGSGAWVSFDPSSPQPVHVRIGISYVSEENARANLREENPQGTSFDTLKQKAEVEWNRRLTQISIEGGTPDQRTMFATALYHSLMTPTTASDTNGEYRGMDGKVHRILESQHAQYANFSGWDVYRSQFQLLTWLDPKAGSDVAQSLLNQSWQNNGEWDRWTHNSGETHVMNGDPAAPAIADIWAFGGPGFDAHAALASLVQAANHPTADDLNPAGCPVECIGERPGLDQWLRLHYIPVGAPAWGPAADTLEDVSAEFGISMLAQRLEQEDIHRRFLARAQYWRNIWNPKAALEGGYFQNRNADGSWALVQDDGDKAPHAFTPATGDGFVEGSAAQYIWMIPFNVHGLFEAMGGNQRAIARLDAFFFDASGKPAVTKAGPLHAELDSEPSIGTPWLYNFAGQPWKTQQLVRQVLNSIWRNVPEGMPGNEDLGEMSSWAVFASLGLYPEIPGRTARGNKGLPRTSSARGQPCLCLGLSIDLQAFYVRRVGCGSVPVE
jgi:predicted alpha-1,2-mannosidase